MICDLWLPVRRRSGERQWVGPMELTAGLETDPVMRVDWGRRDLDSASYEFLIGLLSSAVAPKDDRHWEDWLREPPQPAELRAELEPLSQWFSLAGEGVRFAQDREPFEKLAGKRPPAKRPAERLLLNAPGENTLKLGKDFFVRGQPDAVLSLPAAAVALYAHQQFASSGGGGFRVGLRGGGPWTARVIGRVGEPDPPLWHTLWYNVEGRDRQARRGNTRHTASRFPWTRPTRLSDGSAPKDIVEQQDAHPQIVYWGNPRRIRLSFAAAAGRRCALTGREDPWVVDGFYVRKHGADYASESFRHPLTPYYRKNAKATEWLPAHPQPAGLTPVVWARVCSGAFAQTREPPQVLEAWRERVRKDAPATYRVRLEGLDFDSAKCRGWAGAECPLYAFRSPGVEHAFNEAVAGWIAAMRMVSGRLGRSLRIARTGSAKIGRNDPDRAYYEQQGQRLIRAGEATFYRQLESLAVAPRRRERAAQALLDSLAGAARRILNGECPWVDARDFRHHVEARTVLERLLAGKGGDGQRLYRHLGVAQPDPETELMPEKPKPTAQAWRDRQAYADARSCLGWWKQASRARRDDTEELRSLERISEATLLDEIEANALAIRLLVLCSEQPRERVLIVAGALACVRMNRNRKRVAQQVGQPGLKAPPRGALSPVDLRRLLKTPPAQLLQPMRDLVRAVRARINVFDLAYQILTWDRAETRQRFLYDYYGMLAMPTLPDEHLLSRGIETHPTEDSS